MDELFDTAEEKAKAFIEKCQSMGLRSFTESDKNIIINSYMQAWVESYVYYIGLNENTEK